MKRVLINVMFFCAMVLQSGPSTFLCAQEEQETNPKLLCVAESSHWRATGLHAQVMEFCKKLEKMSDVVRLLEMGKSSEGRVMPLLVLADPPVASPAEAKRSGKMVVYAQGGIHSGECCGKEALQILAREIATRKDHPLLKNLVILIAPIYNPDGNERMKKDNRPGQAGPIEGMGQRPTAQGYDLNRDNTKLDSPEAQALTKLLVEWDPYVAIDTHTTNGSYHQNTLTFDGPVNPAGDASIIDFVRKTYLPAISKSLEAETGYKTTFYGNYNREKTRWTTYEGRPRFGTRARGIRGIVSILTEAYKYASYKDRVLCTKAFCEHLLRYASLYRAEFERLVTGVRSRTIALGANPKSQNKVAIRAKVARIDQDIVLRGWVEKLAEGAPKGSRPRPTTVKRDYKLEHWGAYEPSLEVVRPTSYVYPASMKKLTEKLRQHGIEAQPVPEQEVVAAEIYRIDNLQFAKRAYQHHKQAKINVTSRAEQLTVGKDMMIVSTAHPLGNLIVYLLEPMAEDGLTTWNMFDENLKIGGDFPVIRVMKPVTLGIPRKR